MLDKTKKPVIEKNVPIKIDKGVPMPTKVTGHIFPFAQMEIGDSFWTDIPGIWRHVQAYSRKHKVTFSSRAEGKGRRIWRVEYKNRSHLRGEIDR